MTYSMHYSIMRKENNMSTNKENRRAFLKKAAYAAPVVLAMGPLSAQAGNNSSKINATVQAGANNTIIVNKPNGGTVVVTPQAGGKLANFNKFLHH